MQYLSPILFTLFASLAAAVPTGNNDGGAAPYDPCQGLFDIPQCCATDILGVLDLDCHPPPKFPISANNFRSICADIGQRARCCVLPVAGQAVLCTTPVGV